MEVNIYFWIGFHILIFLILGLDLGIFSRKEHKVPLREALIWVSVWITLALLFNLFVLIEFGRIKALEFLTGYLIEYSLSVDNIFVFILIFSYFAVPDKYQHKILFWGIIGALVMRGIFIFAGVALINKFHWIVIIFGGFLLVTGIKMLFQQDIHVDPSRNAILRFSRKLLPVTEEIHEGRFFVRINHRTYATTFFLVLLIIESSDLLFAVDSIPAVLAISQERFIVYTSNIFAILGLRSLYFAISGIMDIFCYINKGLALILAFVGVKMIASFFHFEISIMVSLSVIISILLISVLASLIIKNR
jgi:tellurite resistance protein TerC